MQEYFTWWRIWVTVPSDIQGASLATTPCSPIPHKVSSLVLAQELAVLAIPYGANGGNRTLISCLEDRNNSRYTTYAFWFLNGTAPFFLGSEYIDTGFRVALTRVSLIPLVCFPYFALPGEVLRNFSSYTISKHKFGTRSKNRTYITRLSVVCSTIELYWYEFYYL